MTSVLTATGEPGTELQWSGAGERSCCCVDAGTGRMLGAGVSSGAGAEASRPSVSEPGARGDGAAINGASKAGAVIASAAEAGAEQLVNCGTGVSFTECTTEVGADLPASCGTAPGAGAEAALALGGWGSLMAAPADCPDPPGVILDTPEAVAAAEGRDRAGDGFDRFEPAGPGEATLSFCSGAFVAVGGIGSGCNAFPNISMRIFISCSLRALDVNFLQWVHFSGT